jgi:hypothetical protein
MTLEEIIHGVRELCQDLACGRQTMGAIQMRVNWRIIAVKKARERRDTTGAARSLEKSLACIMDGPGHNGVRNHLSFGPCFFYLFSPHQRVGGSRTPLRGGKEKEFINFD